MKFIIIIIVIGSIGFIVHKVKELKTNRLRKAAEEIQKKYPLAYKNFVSKNHIVVSTAKYSDLEKITNQSIDYWSNEEQRLQEQEKRRQEIEQKYDDISRLYPNGLKKWTKLNPFSAHEKVVSNRYKIRDYEQAIKEAQEYDKWEEEQDEFKNECLEIAKETLPNFGKCYYDVPFTKLNEDGECVDGKYVVWQFFPGAYCLESDLDYLDFVSIKSNTKDIIRFKRKEVCWPKSVYEKIDAFIMELAKKYPISIYLNTNEEEWSSESLNFHYNGIIFGLGLVSDKVETYNSAIYPILNGKPLPPKLKNRHIIIIDMQTGNEQLKSVCKWIIDNNKDKHPLITYISLLKGIDREEMIDLINNEKKKREEEEERQNREREDEEKRIAELKRKEEEQKERNRLRTLSDSRKNNAQAYLNVLQINGISCLYHFTDESNLESIKEHGGLFSWQYCEDHGIKIPMPGGGVLSRKLDEERELQDYVRLCFTKNHPMMYIARNEGRIKKPVLLMIDPDVVTIDATKFSNKNATIKREPVNIGNTLDDLQQIHFNTIKCNTHFDLADDEKSYFQAEVLVKTFVPIKYIKNIDFPLYV